jgi:hypothetical protein
MGMYIQDSLNKEKHMERVIIHGIIKVKSMMVSGLEESGKAMECGKMLKETATWVHGKIVRLLVMGSLPGLMVISMRENGTKV